ncbi:hypothetical protein G7Y89_g527 [Cudoniella acicularis]|uniref:Lysine-specific metallo-endopeptidase domain-containing protein n=1 Tax=Cudoniella acicularis TaxID=354080 RepID=A0A8H4RYZ6_9HELO|nr:hypothetical protein G7Y89_g527 [Cudoniella acicularis]
MIIPVASLYLPSLLLLAAATSNAGVVGFSKKSNLLKRNNISKYYECSAVQEAFINQAYKDTLKLADNIQPFLPVRDELFAPGQQPGPLEIRYFGADIAPSNDPKPLLVRTVISNIANWYPWPIFDWIFGKRIEVSCIDLPNKTKLTCETQIGNQRQKIAAYALSENGAQIVFCELFFNHLTLDQVQSNLQNDPIAQKDLTQKKSSAHVMFHEMTHLTIITQTMVVKDLLSDPVTPTGVRTYGPRLCEKLAARFPSFAGNNADNYAWYATAKYFSNIFGLPNTPTFSLTNDTDQPDVGPFLDVLDATDDSSLNNSVVLSGYVPDGQEIKDVLSFAQSFKNFPSNLSAHPSGLAIPTATGDAGGPPPAVTTAPAQWVGFKSVGKRLDVGDSIFTMEGTAMTENINLGSPEHKLAREQVLLNYFAELAAYPEFEILDSLVHQPDASVTDAVQKTLSLTAAALASNESGALGNHPWHHTTSLLEIAQRTAPANQVKLVEYVVQLGRVTITNPATGNPLENEGYIVWTQLPSLGYGAADEWHAFNVSDSETTPMERRRWYNFIAFLAQLSNAADVDYRDVIIPELDFSFWSYLAFKYVFEPEDIGAQAPTDVAIRTACLWLVHAADRLWGNIKYERIFGKVGNDPGTKFTREMWDMWERELPSIKSKCTDEETRKLVDEALAQMRRASSEG